MVYLKLILTTFFWGGTFIAGKFIAGKVDPFAAAFLRFLIASIFLLFLTKKIEGRLPGIPPGKIIIICLLGLSGIFSYNVLFFTGLNHIQANQASLIIACNPIFITLCSVIFFKEKISPLKVAGLCLSVTGALIVITDGDPLSLFKMGLGKGQLLIFGCVISWVIYSILGKTAMDSLSPIVSVCYSSIAGALLLSVPAISRGMLPRVLEYTALEWVCLFYLGIFGTVLGFFWYYQGIKAIGPMKTGIFINFVPVSAIVLSFLILNEPLSASLIVGAACVTAGVYITNNRP